MGSLIDGYSAWIDDLDVLKNAADLQSGIGILNALPKVAFFPQNYGCSTSEITLLVRPFLLKRSEGSLLVRLPHAIAGSLCKSAQMN
jgi:hypothetical protein